MANEETRFRDINIAIDVLCTNIEADRKRMSHYSDKKVVENVKRKIEACENTVQILKDLASMDIESKSESSEYFVRILKPGIDPRRKDKELFNNWYEGKVNTEVCYKTFLENNEHPVEEAITPERLSMFVSWLHTLGY